MDNIVNQYFNKIFCINLDKRIDRWINSIIEFKKHSLKVERFAAIDGQFLESNGKISAAEIGCSLSHSAILRKMVKNKWNRILILEDDIKFIKNFQQFFYNNLKNIPEEWDLLYLAGNHLIDPVMINSVIGKVIKTYTTSCYGIYLEMAEAMINEIDKLDAQVDVVYSWFHPTTLSYTFKPNIAWQKSGYSDIQYGYIDYGV